MKKAKTSEIIYLTSHKEPSGKEIKEFQAVYLENK